MIRYLIGISIDKYKSISKLKFADITLGEDNSIKECEIQESEYSTLNKDTEVYIRLSEEVGVTARNERELSRKVTIEDLTQSIIMVAEIVNTDTNDIKGATAIELFMPEEANGGIKQKRIGYLDNKGNIIDRGEYLSRCIDRIGVYTDEKWNSKGLNKIIAYRPYLAQEIRLYTNNGELKGDIQGQTIASRVYTKELNEITTLYNIKLLDNKDIVKVGEYYLIYSCIWVKEDRLNTRYNEINPTSIVITSNCHYSISEGRVIEEPSNCSKDREICTYDGYINIDTRDGKLINGTGYTRFIDRTFINRKGDQVKLKELRDIALKEQGYFYNRYSYVPDKDKVSTKKYRGVLGWNEATFDTLVGIFGEEEIYHEFDKALYTEKEEYYIKKEEPLFIAKSTIEFMQRIPDDDTEGLEWSNSVIKGYRKGLCGRLLLDIISLDTDIPYYTGDSRKAEEYCELNTKASYSDTYMAITELIDSRRLPKKMMIDILESHLEKYKIIDTQALNDWRLDFAI